MKKELNYTNDLIKGHKESWVKYSCYIMPYASIDRRYRSIINFMVNYSSGTIFIKSIDTSSFMKFREKIYDWLDKFVEEIGEQNIVQVITRQWKQLCVNW